jgi:hypothetical protein
MTYYSKRNIIQNYRRNTIGKNEKTSKGVASKVGKILRNLKACKERSWLCAFASP